MNNFDFFKQVLGDAGYYCIVGLKKNTDKPVQKFFPNIDQAIAVAENLVSEGYDAYYALATFEDGKSRKVVNVKQMRSLYADLDCGEGKPYATQGEAIDALKKFCKELQMPRPTLVNSGGGIHAYWTLTEPISLAEWKPLAEKLKYLFDQHDLFADPAVTADPARILRVPGTLNYKLDTARPVAVLGTPAPAVTVEAIVNVIGHPILERKSYIPRGEMDPLTKALLGNYTNRFKNIMLKTVKGYGCQQLKYIIENQTTMSEPMWRAGLSVAKFCADADVAIKKISSGHPDYSEQATDRKVMGIKGGPYTCDTFEKYNPGGCEGCPNRGEIKSPIVLGREVLEASAEDNIIEGSPEDVFQDHTQSYVIPTYPEPYFRGRDGGVYKKIAQKDDEPADVLIYHNDLYVTRRLMDTDSGEAVVVRLHLPRDGIREFTVPLTSVTSKDELRKCLSAKGVAVIKIDEIMHYITKWVTTMQYTAKADTARTQFGWVDDNFDAFVLGDKEVRVDRVDHNPPSIATAQLMHAFQPKGTFEGWKNVMDFYNRPGMEIHQFAIGCGIGSILTKLTPINGAILHLFSPESGVGKTTSAIAGLSVWGNPYDLMTKKDDTFNAKMNRAQLYGNLPLVVDEVTNHTPKEISDFAYLHPAGFQKSRMTSSANLERTRGNQWHQLAISTGNASMIEKMTTFKALPKGEAMRILEVRVPPMDLNKADTDRLSEGLLQNYGQAAVPLLQYIMGDIENIKLLYKSTQAKLDSICGFGPADRFYSVIVTDGIMGLILGRRAGLFNYDVGGVVTWLQKHLSHVKENIKSMDSDAEATLTLFLAENVNNILRIKSTDDQREIKGEVMEHLVAPEAIPRGTMVARYEYDNKMLFVFPTFLKTWCVERQINYEGFLDQLKKGRTQAHLCKKRMGKGTRINLPPASVLWINCKGFMTDDVESEFAEKAATAVE